MAEPRTTTVTVPVVVERDEDGVWCAHAQRIPAALGRGLWTLLVVAMVAFTAYSGYLSVDAIATGAVWVAAGRYHLLPTPLREPCPAPTTNPAQAQARVPARAAEARAAPGRDAAPRH